jgi:alcohol dehydrogenase (cytochrome c)
MVACAAAIGFCAVLATAQDRPFTPVTDAMMRNPSPNDWLSWRGTTRSQGYSALDQITRSNVKQLQLAWSWAMEPGLQEPAPIVYDGVMYLPNPGGMVQALDAATGDLLWQYKHEYADGKPRNTMTRGLSIYDDKVFLNTPDARIVALDARTGKVVWNVQVADPEKGFSFNTASLIVKGRVISGLSGCTRYIEEKCALTAHDAKTGKELWRTHTITRPGEPGSETWNDIEYIYRVGGGMWIPGSYDPDLDVIFWSTSQAKPWARAARGTNDLGLYTNSLLAVNPDTGKILWYVQPRPGESHDLDEVFESVLVDIGPRKSLFKMGKIGIMWEIDRATGKIVRASDLGYQNLVDVNPQTGKVEYRAGMIPVLGKSLHMCPSVSGIRNWPAMAYSPETQAFYIPTQLTCSDMTFIESEDRRPGGSGNGYGPRKDSLHPQAEGKYLGQLVAMHADGHVLWKKPQRSGLTSAALTTAGGIVFYGDWNRYIYARDVKTGDLLWQTRAPASAQGYPITYAVRGRQYVAFPAGIGALAGWFNANPTQLTPELKRPTSGNSILVFALPQ